MVRQKAMEEKDAGIEAAVEKLRVNCTTLHLPCPRNLLSNTLKNYGLWKNASSRGTARSSVSQSKPRRPRRKNLHLHLHLSPRWKIKSDH